MSVKERGTNGFGVRTVFVGLVFAVFFVGVIAATFLGLGQVQPEISEITQRVTESGGVSNLEAYLSNGELTARIQSIMG
ncbi:MAG: hypothetical protein ABEK59_01115 [Halobacteria archaeon]